METGDSNSIHNAIQKLLKSSAREKAGQANLKKYSKDYSSEKAVNVWNQIYESTFH